MIKIVQKRFGENLENIQVELIRAKPIHGFCNFNRLSGMRIYTAWTWEQDIELKWSPVVELTDVEENSLNVETVDETSAFSALNRYLISW